jgi:hypothetical protein
MTAIQETAERFDAGKEEATWFLRNRTCMDDATGGACDKERTLKVSQDMEDIISNGGFKFNETVMSMTCCERRGNRENRWASGGIPRHMRFQWT